MTKKNICFKRTEDRRGIILETQSPSVAAVKQLVGAASIWGFIPQNSDVSRGISLLPEPHISNGFGGIHIKPHDDSPGRISITALRDKLPPTAVNIITHVFPDARECEMLNSGVPSVFPK